jgi:O-antigen/teichoic acid export membrane protein
MLASLLPRTGTVGTRGTTIKYRLPAVTQQIGSVAVGLGVLGLSSFAFLAISARALGPAALAPLATLWVVINAAGPAFFHPLEQELGRAVSHANALGRGSRSVFLRGGALGGGLVVLCGIGLLVFYDSLSEHVFNGESVLVPALLVGVIGLGAEHLTRGAFAGAQAFGRYGWQLGLDGGFRLVGAAVLALVGVASVGWYGFVLAITPLLAVLFTSRQLGPAVRPAPPDQAWGQLARAVGVLMIGTALAQFVVNAAPVAANILAAPGEEARAGVFISVLVLARIPVFLFAAIQAAFLPGLAALVAQDDVFGFRRRLRTVLMAVSGLGAAGLLVFLTIGPWLVRLFYGPGFETSRLDLWPLAAGAGLYMVAAAMAQTLVSLRAYTSSVIGWVLGTGVFLLALLVPARLEQRVGLAFFAATAVAALFSGLALHRRLSRPLNKHEAPAAPLP